MQLFTLRRTLCPLAGLALLALPVLSASAQVTASVTAPGTSNLWLAGMPAGSTASGGDAAPDESPALVTGFALNGGDVLAFSATGSVSFAGDTPTDPTDGDFGYDATHSAGDENGISDVTMPVDALIGVFLGSDQPSLTAAPGALDFSTQAAQDYGSLSPELQQVFFIGDGVTSTNFQQFVTAPAGATRLYLGGMDGSGWYNNTGSFEVAVTDLNAPAAVPEASTTVSLGLLLTFGLAGMAVNARRKAKMIA